ncbi:MAG: hypothetical protein JNM84_13455 [Planctomycetes bacterium]|nr:hypothetical protein [Planctomycetota bacterium]
MSEVRVTAERSFLEAGVACVLPALQRRGFAYALGNVGVASGGPFATCQFSCGRITMGLIVRRAHRLGSPNYSIGAGYAGHEDMVWAIGRSGEESLVSEGYIDCVSRDGGDAFEALRKDLETIVLPVLDASRANFEEAIERAVARVRARRGWG